MSRLALLVALPLLMIDGLIEVGFVGSMVGFLHDRAGKFFTIDAASGSGSFNLHGKPAGLIVDQGHTSNGAAGTAIVLVGILGFLVDWSEKRRARKTAATGRRHSGLFIFWVVMTVLSALLTLAALIYTFVVTAQTDDQTIDLAVARANPEPLMYPDDKWTPENWFVAVLALPLAHASDRRVIRNHVHLMRGWRWNLIPLFILGVVVATAAVWDLLRGRRWTEGESREKLRHHSASAHS